MAFPTVSRSALWESTFGRRLMLLIVLCTVVPILLIGTLAYREVTDRLRQQAEKRLYQETKAVAMSISERLLFLDATLDSLVGELATKTDFTSWNLEGRPLIARQFTALAVFRGDQPARMAWGPSFQRTSISPAAHDHLRGGHTTILVGDRTLPIADLFVVRMLEGDAGTALWGQVAPTYLWGVGPESTLPAASELAVANEDGFLIRAETVPDSMAQRLLDGVPDALRTAFPWRASNGESYFASRWVVPMNTRYAAGNWILSLSRRQSEVLAPLDRFRKTFPQLIALGALIALLVSSRHVRRTLTPLAALNDATTRISRGDLSERVEVRSGDELEALAGAFNLMSDEVGRQLAAVETMVAVGQASLARQDGVEMTKRLLEDLARVLPIHTAEVGLATPGGWRKVSYHADGVVTVAAISDTVRPSIGTQTLEAPFHHPTIDVPIRTERLELGWLRVTRASDQAFTESDQTRIRAIADHVALALDHLDLSAALGRERKRLRALVEHLPHGVLLLDQANTARLSNRLAREYLPLLTPTGGPEAIQELAGQSLDLLASADGAEWHELEVAGPPPRIFMVAVSRALSRADRQGTPGAVVVMRDVTTQREAEEHGRRQERLATVGRLAAGISHDFNNMLQGIMMAASMIPKERLEAEMILQQCRRAADMIRRISDFTRESPHRPTHLDLAPLVRESARMIEMTLPDTITTQLDIRAHAMWTRADAVQIQQVVQNLMVNARDAMAENATIATPGTLTVSLHDTDLADDPRVAEVGDGDWLGIAITDTGPGIPASVRPRIFDPFFTTKALGTGTGLGLAQVVGIVEQHGGFVDVETSRNGTTFTVHLPKLDPPEDASLATDAEPRRTTSASDRRAGVILAVDDDETVLASIRDGLSRLGHHVLVAHDGREALHLYLANPSGIDVVLSDVRMPDVSGAELLRRLRRADPDVVVVLMTGYAGIEASDLDADELAGWLRKPFSIEDLAQTVEHALQGHVHG